MARKAAMGGANGWADLTAIGLGICKHAEDVGASFGMRLRHAIAIAAPSARAKRDLGRQIEKADACSQILINVLIVVELPSKASNAACI